MSVLRTAANCALALGVVGGAVALPVYAHLNPLKPIVTGDFDGDGKKDAFCRRGESEEFKLVYDVELEENNGDGYVYGYCIKRCNSEKHSEPKKGSVKDSEYLNGWGDSVFVGDVNKDGIADITFYKDEPVGRFSKYGSWVAFIGDGRGGFALSREHSGWTIDSSDLWDSHKNHYLMGPMRFLW